MPGKGGIAKSEIRNKTDSVNYRGPKMLKLNPATCNLQPATANLQPAPLPPFFLFK